MTPNVNSVVYRVVGNVGVGRLRAGPRYITQDAKVGQCVWMGEAYLVKISHDIDRLRREGTVGSTKYDRSFLIHCSLPVARPGWTGKHNSVYDHSFSTLLTPEGPTGDLCTISPIGYDHSFPHCSHSVVGL